MIVRKRKKKRKTKIRKIASEYQMYKAKEEPRSTRKQLLFWQGHIQAKLSQTGLYKISSRKCCKLLNWQTTISFLSFLWSILTVSSSAIIELVSLVRILTAIFTIKIASIFLRLKLSKVWWLRSTKNTKLPFFSTCTVTQPRKISLPLARSAKSDQIVISKAESFLNCYRIISAHSGTITVCSKFPRKRPTLLECTSLPSMNWTLSLLSKAMVYWMLELLGSSIGEISERLSLKCL